MTQIHQIFKQAMDRYGVRGKELAALAGITPNHLSDFRSGKKWLSPEVFMALLEGMDELSPGSRQYFCQMLAEKPLSSKQASVGEKLIEMIEAADDDEMEAAMIAIGKKWKRSRSVSVSENSSRLSRFHTEDAESAIAV